MSEKTNTFGLDINVWDIEKKKQNIITGKAFIIFSNFIDHF
jgi:hypothetical protein